MRVSHAIGAQVAALTAAVTIAAFALPVLADQTVELSPVVSPVKTYEFSDAQYAQNVVTIFRRSGDVASYDNRSIETSAFDFQAYIAHTCYRPTDFDMAHCEEMFGPYANLRTTLESGKLRMILTAQNILATEQTATTTQTTQAQSSESAVVTTAQDAAQTPQAPALTEEQQRNKLRAQRVAQLWAACQTSFPDNADAKMCFQRNYRLIDRADVEIDGNIY